MEKKRKVLFFTPCTCGGAERMTIYIAKMLPRDEFDVMFIVIGRSMGDIVKFIPSDYPQKMMYQKSIWHGCTFKMWNVIRKEKPDIVFCSILSLSTRLIIAAKLSGTKVIVRSNIGFSEIKQPINKFLIPTTFKWADLIVAQQKEMRDGIITCTGISSDKVITLQNPIDTALINEKVKAESPFDKEDKSIKFVWTARISRGKGQDILLKAFTIVHKNIPNSKLYLIGKYNTTDVFYRELRQYIKDYELSNSVFMPGFDDNPYKWVVNADCFVMPSRMEGLPNSLIDAMYLKKPVVATTCIPVISRIVENGYNGLLVPSEDFKTLAEAMQKAIHLKDFEITYIPASKESYISLFQSI